MHSLGLRRASIIPLGEMATHQIQSVGGTGSSSSRWNVTRGRRGLAIIDQTASSLPMGLKNVFRCARRRIEALTYIENPIRRSPMALKNVFNPDGPRREALKYFENSTRPGPSLLK